MANQKCPNLRYKTYSKLCLSSYSYHLSLNGVLINLFSPTLHLSKFFYQPAAPKIPDQLVLMSSCMSAIHSVLFLLCLPLHLEHKLRMALSTIFPKPHLILGVDFLT
jgi:hypothetical protein